MDLQFEIVFLGFAFFLICIVLRIVRSIKGKRIVVKGSMPLVLMVTIPFLVYSLILNGVFKIEMAHSTVLLYYYLFTFGVLDLYLIAFDARIGLNGTIKSKMYFGISIAYLILRSAYYFVMLGMSFLLFGSYVGAAFMGQLTFDSLLNYKRFDKAMFYSDYYKAVFDNKILVESIKEDRCVSVSKSYANGLFKKRMAIIESYDLPAKLISENGNANTASVVFVPQFGNNNNFALKIEKDNNKYILTYFERGDKKNLIIND